MIQLPYLLPESDPSLNRCPGEREWIEQECQECVSDPVVSTSPVFPVVRWITARSTAYSGCGRSCTLLSLKTLTLLVRLLE